MEQKIINNWCLQQDTPRRISGNVSNHPGFADGDFITTSTVVAVDPESECVRTRSGTVYKLGNPATDYELVYPDAKARFFKAAPAEALFKAEPSD